MLQTLVDRQFEALDAAGVAPEDRWRTIVLASLVQREAGLEREDFYKVSRVFQNRLDPGLGERLLSPTRRSPTAPATRTPSCDDRRRARRRRNPYNTYVHPGLPIGPISNPGDLAIDAAMHPADGTWLFFVTWNLDTGETMFSDDRRGARGRRRTSGCAWMDEHPDTAE